MERLLSKTSKLDAVLLIFISILFVSFHFFFVYFINSTYITAFVGEKLVGIIYAIGALLNIGLFMTAPKLLRKRGVVSTTFFIASLEAFSLIVLAFPIHQLFAIFAFLLHMAVSPILLYCLDILLEQYSDPSRIGSMRGMFLTMWNIPPVITPFIAGLILNSYGTIPATSTAPNLMASLYNLGYWKIYIISAVFLIPFAIILKANFSNFIDPKYPKIHTKDLIQSFYKNKNIFDVFADRLLLNFYFAWIVVYIPIYLHNYIGFSWEQIGIILSTMLLPFILFQRLIGRLQDQKHEEKSILIFGFLIVSLSTIIIPFIDSPSIFAWIIIFFIANTGAAFIEVSSESYFYGHINPTNSGYISLFRMTRTIPYLIMPIIVWLSLTLLPFSQMFLILGCIMFLGVRYAFLIDSN